MATLDEMFPSKYMKAIDLDGKEAKVKIRDVQVEVLKTLDGRENTKAVLYFEPPYGKKGLPLNKTNFQAVQDVTGQDDTEDWPGCELVLFEATATMGGKLYKVVRIKSPIATKAKATAKAAADAGAPDLNDEVPF